MSNKLFKGIYPALITPFDDDGEIMERSARDIIEWELERGVQGFYINGATGEGPVVSDKSRMRMAEIAVDQVAGRGKIINHIGAINMQSCIALAKHAEACGCDAISSLPPTFFFGYSDGEMLDYYRALSDNCGLPLLAYATKMFAAPDITEFVSRLIEIPTVIGLKFTRFNYYEMRNILELNGGDINVINGPDEMLICGLTMGADAGIGSTYNIMPDRYVALYNAFASGDFEAARRMQFDINHVIRVLLAYGGIAAIKEVFTRGGIPSGGAAFPAKRFTGERSDALIADLAAAGYSFEG